MASYFYLTPNIKGPREGEREEASVSSYSTSSSSSYLSLSSDAGGKNNERQVRGEEDVSALQAQVGSTFQFTLSSHTHLSCTASSRSPSFIKWCNVFFLIWEEEKYRWDKKEEERRQKHSILSGGMMSQCLCYTWCKWKRSLSFNLLWITFSDTWVRDYVARSGAGDYHGNCKMGPLQLQLVPLKVGRERETNGHTEWSGDTR